MQTTMNQKKSNRFTPLLMALCIIIGIIIGTFYANHFSGNRLNIINSGSNRLSNLLQCISRATALLTDPVTTNFAEQPISWASD